jgi:Ca2+-binding RTX toxin-like protein
MLQKPTTAVPTAAPLSLADVAVHGAGPGAFAELFAAPGAGPEDALLAGDDLASTSEDSTVKITVLANDSDSAGGGLVVAVINGAAVRVGDIVTLASGARVLVNANGTLTYQTAGAFEALDTGQVQTDSFTYQTRSTGPINGAPSEFSLASLDGSNGFRINGAAAGDRAGGSVSQAGDVNGDGFDDVIIGAAGASPGSRAGAGAAYVVFGSDAGFDASLTLADLDGTNGFRLSGVDAGDAMGSSVAGAGDINGDGIDDIIVGAPLGESGSRQSTGETYVVFGSTSAFSADFDLSTLNGTNGFTISGDIKDYAIGLKVSSAGDVNGDGVDDLLISAPYNDVGGTRSVGSCYVVFGSDGGLPANLLLSQLDGSNGFRINGATPKDLFGTSISRAGDINGDGIDDILVGAEQGVDVFIGSPGEGKAYVIFGKNSGFSAVMTVGTLNGSDGFALTGLEDYDYLGSAVSAAGDINGDGLDDIVIGAYGAAWESTGSRGEVYVVYGSTSAFPAFASISTLDGTNGFKITGLAPGDEAGWSVSDAGDVNADGLDDLIISSGPFGDKDSYVLFGRTGGFGAVVDLPTLDSGEGLRIRSAAGEWAGSSVSAAGDLNGDGIDDLILGASTAAFNGVNSGSAFVIFGSADLGTALSNPATVTVTIRGANELLTGTNEVDTLLGGLYGDEIRGLGGDDSLSGGLGNDLLSGGPGDDALIGGDGVDTASYADALSSVVVSLATGLASGGGGSDSLSGIENITGSAFDDQLTGFTGANSLSGGDGADLLSGLGGEDILFGGKGDDLLIGGAGNDQLLGGDGLDTASYATATAGVVIKLLTGSATGGAGIDSLSEIENLIGSGLDDSLTGSALGNRIDGGAGLDALNGGKGKDLLIGGLGADVLSGGSGKDVFLFLSLNDSSLSGRDLITDYAKGDILDLSAIDANAALAGDQGFVQVGAFTGQSGQLRLSYNAGTNQTTLELDVDGDSLADFALLMSGQHLSSAGWSL